MEANTPPSTKGGGFAFMFARTVILDKLPHPGYNAEH
jgi:hypothetical protein